MPENYLSKQIEAPSGENATVWDGSLFICDVENGTGSVSLSGYVDEGAFLGDSLPVHTSQYRIADITQLATYESFFSEALTMLVSDPSSLFYGSAVEPCPIDLHGRNLIKSLTVETGAPAECWRCAVLRADLKSGFADFVMRGWKDVDAFCAGKSMASGRDKAWTVRAQISDFDTYDALYAEIVGLILADPAHELFEAVLTAVS